MLFAVLALAGCTAAPVATPSPSASSATTPSPTATSEPDATPSADASATCDTVLTDAEYTRLAEDGLALRADGATFHLGPVMTELADAGALTCHWVRPSSDVAVWYAELPVDEAGWAERRAQLEASGWTQSDDPIAGTLLAPADYDANYQPSMVWDDGTLYFVSYGSFLGSVAALQS
ncbi:hypothetical protein [Agromyces bauzanensis]